MPFHTFQMHEVLPVTRSPGVMDASRCSHRCADTATVISRNHLCGPTTFQFGENARFAPRLCRREWRRVGMHRPCQPLLVLVELALPHPLLP
jgi:hypothetical protein